MKENETSTIAAIATAMSPSGISIIRISGEESFSIIDRVYKGKGGKKKLSGEPSHTIHYGYIHEPEDEDLIIDEVMVLLMKAPKSYTAEDTVEIDCHGGIYVTQRILEAVIRAGAALAEPGEFTKRAFLNGRIDLSRAEAVIDVINAKNDYALNSSVKQLRGSISEKIRRMRDVILDDISYLEAGMDDPEHISLENCGETIMAHMEDISSDLEHLKKTAKTGRILKEGINTVILGKPNAGKSSLMNYITGTDRAIVTNIAGTTRDILEEQVRMGSLCLNLLDTAGIRDTENVVEKIGVEKALDALKNADLILFVLDGSAALDDNDMRIFEMIENQKGIIILNKSDLEQLVTGEMIRGIRSDIPIVSMSAKEETGLEELEQTIRQLFLEGRLETNDEIYVTNTRHLYEIDETIHSISMVINAIRDGLPEDFFTIDLMNAYTHLGNILGESIEEDVVNRIFEKFCMGK